MDTHPDIIRAINHLDNTPLGRRYDRMARRRYGISGKKLAAKEVQGESGFRRGAVSSAGARGYTQFMPPTRAEYLRRYGVDAWHGPRSAIKAMELYQTAGHGIESYNPGDPGYRDYILGQRLSHGDKRLLRSGKSGRSAGSGAGSFTLKSPQHTKVGLRYKTIPGQSFAADRQQLRDQLFLSGKPLTVQSLLDYKASLNSMKDVPAQRVPNGITVRQSGGKPIRVRTSAGGYKSAVHAALNGEAPTGLKHLKGVGHFEGKPVAAWIVPVLSYARAHGWKGTVSSGFRSFAEQKRIYDSGVRPAAVPGTSNHEGDVFPRGAVDVTDAVGLARILQRSPYARLLQYAGSKDPVHFSHPHNGGY